MEIKSEFGGFPVLEQKKMDRINELARKSKAHGLCEDEKKEQHRLRQEYLSKFREVFRDRLESIKFADEPASETPGIASNGDPGTPAPK
jgi:uncharacterized protein YnzC (UPF0291/DUF896 family)